MSIQDQIREIVSSIEKQQQTIKKLGQELLQKCYQDLFDRYPTLETLSFKGYTLYFNDGDELFYGVYSDPDYDLELNGVTLNDTYEYDYDWKTTKYTLKDSRDPECKIQFEDFIKIGKEINEILFQIPNETIKDIYGDHVKVVVSRTGTETEDYTDHD